MLHVLNILTVSLGQASALHSATGSAPVWVGILMLLIPIAIFLIWLVCLVFWLWMLIDCLMREFNGSDKIVWVLVIIFLSIIGALIYFFVGRKQGQKSRRSAQ